MDKQQLRELGELFIETLQGEGTGTNTTFNELWWNNQTPRQQQDYLDRFVNRAQMHIDSRQLVGAGAGGSGNNATYRGAGSSMTTGIPPGSV